MVNIPEKEYQELRARLKELEAGITERKKAEESLARFGKILEESLNEIYIFDAETLQFMLVNEGGRKNLGYTMEELKKLTPLDLKTEYTPESFKALVEPLYSGAQKIVRFTTNHKRKDGTRYDVDVNLQTTIYEDRPAFVAVILDVTDRKKTGEELAEKKDELSLIASSSLDIIFTMTKTGTLRFVSFAAKNILGYEPQEIVGTKFMKYIAKEEWSKCWKAIADVFLHGRIFNFETVAIDRQGNHVPIEINGQLVKMKAGLVAQGSMRNITDRRKVEAEVEEWKNRYEAAVMTSGHVLYDWDSKTNTVTYGGVVEGMLGYSMDEMADGLKHWVELIHPDDRVQFDQDIERLIATKKSANLEYRVRRKDGEYIYIEDTGSFIPDADGNLTRMIGFIKDITERKKAEEELVKHRDHLEELVKERAGKLQEKVKELETFYDASVDRELKMEEMRVKIKELESELKERLMG